MVPTTGLWPRLSHLDAVLTVVHDIPGDERGAQCWDKPERNQRREFQSDGYDRERADRRGEPAGTDPGRSLRRRVANEVDHADAQATCVRVAPLVSES